MGASLQKWVQNFYPFFFEKVLDNWPGVCYNLIRKKRKGNTKMMMKIEKSWPSPEMKNDLYAEGYRFIVRGDDHIVDGTDPWSGMPNTSNNLYAFDNEAEAEAYALTQTLVFSEDHPDVWAIPPHTETFDEWMARDAKEKADKKARKDAREAEKAEAMGLTVEEYKRYKKDKTIAKKLPAEIAECEAEIERLKKEIARKRNYLEELNAKIENIEKP
jgi:hypothetical protein